MPPKPTPAATEEEPRAVSSIVDRQRTPMRRNAIFWLSSSLWCWWCEFQPTRKRKLDVKKLRLRLHECP